MSGSDLLYPSEYVAAGVRTPTCAPKIKPAVVRCEQSGFERLQQLTIEECAIPGGMRYHHDTNTTFFAEHVSHNMVTTCCSARNMSKRTFAVSFSDVGTFHHATTGLLLAVTTYQDMFFERHNSSTSGLWDTYYLGIVPAALET